MSIYMLSEDDTWFPERDEFGADEDIVAVGGDLKIKRLIKAYRRGIFPWYNNPDERIWWSPVVRCLLFHDELIISHSMRNLINQQKYRLTMDLAFHEVLDGCRGGEREGETWLIDEMVDAYTQLFKLGIAHSLEVWEENELVGGLYGESFGRMFFGESMFSRRSNTSKLAFIVLSSFLKSKGWRVLDCQVVTKHLTSLGCRGVKRNDFLDLLKEELNYPDDFGSWTEDFEGFIRGSKFEVPTAHLS